MGKLGNNITSTFVLVICLVGLIVGLKSWDNLDTYGKITIPIAGFGGIIISLFSIYDNFKKQK